MSLDIALLMAGSKERGELEARVTTLLSDIQKSGEYTLFVFSYSKRVGSLVLIHDVLTLQETLFFLLMKYIPLLSLEQLDEEIRGLVLALLI